VDAGARGDAHSSSDATGVGSTTGISTTDVDGVAGSANPLDDKKGEGVGGGATTTGAGAGTTPVFASWIFFASVMRMGIYPEREESLS
jgi:hypothetical protein